MKPLKGIAAALFLGNAVASPLSPASVMAILSAAQDSSPTSSTIPAVLPCNTPRDTLPAITPAIHAIITPTTRAWRIPEPVVTGAPVSCEIVSCTTTAFWYYSSYRNKNCRSLVDSLYCPDGTSFLSTTCLDQNHLPNCLYNSTIFPWTGSSTSRNWAGWSVVPLYETTSKCVPPDPQRNAFPLGALSCYSFCQYTSPLTGDCTWVTANGKGSRNCEITRTSTLSTGVESLGPCIWWGDILAERLVTYDTGSTSTVDWEPYWKKKCIPAQTPTSGGCSWFSYHATPSWRTQTTWPLASTCLYPDAIPSCLYTYSGSCVGLQAAATMGLPPPPGPGPTTTKQVVTVSEPITSPAISAPPAGTGEAGRSWRIPSKRPARRQCWKKNTEVDEWGPSTPHSNGCTWFTSFVTKTSAGKTTISMESTCKPTSTISWAVTTVLTETMVTLGPKSSTLTTSTVTRPVTSRKPSATASARPQDKDIVITLEGKIVDNAVRNGDNLCAHIAPIDGRRLACQLMPTWAKDEFDTLVVESLNDRLDFDDFQYPQHSLMDKWIFDNAALRSEFIARAIAKQMEYNVMHDLALETRFGLDPDVMIEITQYMIDKYPQDFDEDEGTQLEAKRYHLICQLSRGTPMPTDDANAQISYLQSYFDHDFPKPTPSPTRIPVPAALGQYVCQCSLASQTGEFPTTKKTIKTTANGTPTQIIDVCAYSTWPKILTTSITAPPTPVPTDQTVTPGIINCNDIKADGMYGAQTIADLAVSLYRECYNSLLYVKPTGTAVRYGGDWNGFKAIKGKTPASGDGLTGTGKNPMRKWLALSVQYLASACEKGDKTDVIGFRNPGELTWEDFLEFFVERSLECNTDAKVGDSAGLEIWTPGGTYNPKGLQWKLWSLDDPPPFGDGKFAQQWLNGTLPWNETASGRYLNDTSKQIWSETGFGPVWTASAVVAGHKP